MIAGPSPSMRDPVSELRQLLADGRFSEALAWHDTHAEVRGRPDAELLVATAATRTGRYALGESLAATSLERFRMRADDDGRMRAINLLGAIHWHRGHLDEAQRCFTVALDLAQRLRDTRVAGHASNNLALVAHLRGHATFALSLFRAALLEYQRLGDRRGAAQALHNLGLAYRELGSWPEAEDAVAEAVRHAELVAEPGLLALMLFGRAELALARGEFVLAGRALARAESGATQAKDATGIAEARRLRALLLLAEKDIPAAHESASAAYALAQGVENALLRADCAATLALTTMHSGDGDRADTLKAEALRGYTTLGASGLRSRFEREWQRSVA
jgi:tetratricopeptide (TPR) repeat protein